MAYLRAIWTLKTPPTVVIVARHPLLLEKEMLPVDVDPVAVIGRTSLPTLVGVGGWHSVWFATVVKAAAVDVEVEDDADEGVELELWACAYAAIPPETMTSIAATVRIWSLPAFTFMLLRVRCRHYAI